MKAAGIGRPLIGKLRTARWVEAPKSASSGTSISPIESFSSRIEEGIGWWWVKEGLVNNLDETIKIRWKFFARLRTCLSRLLDKLTYGDCGTAGALGTEPVDLGTRACTGTENSEDSPLRSTVSLSN